MKFYSSNPRAVILVTAPFVACRCLSIHKNISCCCKRICYGCDHANKNREDERRLQQKCAFCRTAFPETKEENIEQLMKRIEANDPVALCQRGAEKHKEGDYKSAFEYSARAAAMGDSEAHYQLSILYHIGQGIEKDEKKELYHSKEAAIAGHHMARFNLGFMEAENGRFERAAKHWIIAAKLGDQRSLDGVKALYKNGDLSKEDFTAALRGHKAAIDAMKSPQREEAEKIRGA